MSSSERQDDRNQTVAEVATLLFGTPITALDVIGETLERVTDKSRDVAAVKPQLLAALSKTTHAWSNFDDFRGDPLAIWVELNLGIDLPADQPPRRAKPITVESAAERLAADAGCGIELAREGLRRFLVAAHEVRTPEGRAPFAFKLHQFISGPGKVLATLEPAGKRHITLDAQRFAPGRQTEGTQLYPVHFCRDWPPDKVCAAFDEADTLQEVASRLATSHGGVKAWLADFPEFNERWLATVRERRSRLARTRIDEYLMANPTTSRTNLLRDCHTDMSWLSRWNRFAWHRMLERIPHSRDGQPQLFD